MHIENALAIGNKREAFRSRYIPCASLTSLFSCGSRWLLRSHHSVFNCRVAVGEGVWGHAFVLASRLGTDYINEAAAKFATSLIVHS